MTLGADWAAGKAPWGFEPLAAGNDGADRKTQNAATEVLEVACACFPRCGVAAIHTEFSPYMDEYCDGCTYFRCDVSGHDRMADYGAEFPWLDYDWDDLDIEPVGLPIHDQVAAYEKQRRYNEAHPTVVEAHPTVVADLPRRGFWHRKTAA